MAQSLPAADLRSVLHLAEQALQVQTFWDVEAVLLPGLAALLRSELAVYHHVSLDPAALEEIDVFWPPEVFAVRVHEYSAVMHQHPFVIPFGTASPSGPVQVSDFLTDRQWRSSAVYQESHGPMGAHRQMSDVLARDGYAVRALTVARSGSRYTDRERELLTLVRPHLVAPLRRAYAMSPGYVARRTVPLVDEFVLPSGDQVLRGRALPASVRVTERERQVLELVALGWTNTRIARRLDMAGGTVRKHLEHSYAKLGVDNRVAASSLLRESLR